MSAAALTSPVEPPATASPTIDANLLSPSSDSTSLLVQAMASFGVSDAVDNSTGAFVAAGLMQQSEIAAPIDPQLARSG
jgi:hypothetical protein